MHQILLGFTRGSKWGKTDVSVFYVGADNFLTIIKNGLWILSLDFLHGNTTLFDILEIKSMMMKDEEAQK